MSAQPKTYLTPTEYLALERKSAYKSEYYDGRVFALADVYDKVAIEPSDDDIDASGA